MVPLTKTTGSGLKDTLHWHFLRLRRTTKPTYWSATFLSRRVPFLVTFNTLNIVPPGLLMAVELFLSFQNKKRNKKTKAKHKKSELGPPFSAPQTQLLRLCLWRELHKLPAEGIWRQICSLSIKVLQVVPRCFLKGQFSPQDLVPCFPEGSFCALSRAFWSQSMTGDEHTHFQAMWHKIMPRIWTWVFGRDKHTAPTRLFF